MTLLVLKVSVFWICCIFIDGIRSYSNADCVSLPCYNNGTAVYNNNTCVCQCYTGFSGILCEYELQQSAWPSGPYALLMPSTGCPESESHGWSHGLISVICTNCDGSNFTILRQYKTSAGHLETAPLSELGTRLTGPFGTYSFQLNFCFKHRDFPLQDKTGWPIGDITVFGTGEGCPDGFEEETISIALPNRTYFSFADGYVPSVEVAIGFSGSEIIMKQCRQKEPLEALRFLWKRPVITPQNYQSSCGEARGDVTVEKESLMFYDDGTGVGNISFCVYTPRIHVVTKASKWPSGPYAVLKHEVGCPEKDEHGWRTGYLNFTTNSSVYTIAWPKAYMHDQVYMFSSLFALFFCFKIDDAEPSSDHDVAWAEGSYGVFGVEAGCPPGLFEGNLTLSLPTGSNVTGNGHLPYFHVDDDTNVLTLKCCEKKGIGALRTQGDTQKSFILAKNSDTECDVMNGIYGSLEKIRIFEKGTPRVSMVFCNYTSHYDSGCVIEEEQLCHGTCEPKDGWLQRCEGKTRYMCLEHEFYCVLGGCIPKLWLCDGFRHCPDGSDELPSNCDPEKEASRDCCTSEFRCGDGRCIPADWACDGIVDCDDTSDEKVDNCMKHGMKSVFVCDGGGKRLPRQWLCDGFSQCTDQSDEDVEHCAQKCNANEFYCGDGTCVGKTLVCDRKTDCSDGRDELEHNCKSKCSDTEFFCDADRCIAQNHVCDGTVHCADFTDEDCGKETKLSSLCKNELGVSDGVIPDHNFLASSWTEDHLPYMSRPGLSSWCPEKDDMDPFLQIDLGHVGVIRGIVIFNLDNDSFTEKLDTTECFTFAISYAVFQNYFISYSDEGFLLDTSLHTEHPQKFVLLKPFIARFIRLKMQMQSTYQIRRCLRVELLGCPGQEIAQWEEDISLGGDLKTRVDVEKYTVITSPFSPLNYPANRIFRWTIHIADPGYARVTIEFLRLHDEGIVQSNSCLKDALTIGSFEPFTAHDNGLVATLPTDQSDILVTFATCKRQYVNNTGNTGFSLIVKKESIPTIWNYIGDANIRQGNILTRSFLGLTKQPENQRWMLKSYASGGPIKLTFEEFNVTCLKGINRMSISVADESPTYHCSDNRPHTTYRAWKISIHYIYKQWKDVTRFDGFSAKFEIIPVSNTYQRYGVIESNITSSVGGISDVHRDGRHVDAHLRSCFRDIILHVPEFIINSISFLELMTS